jgi:hypothetical protein
MAFVLWRKKGVIDFGSKNKGRREAVLVSGCCWSTIRLERKRLIL